MKLNYRNLIFSISRFIEIIPKPGVTMKKWVCKYIKINEI